MSGVVSPAADISTNQTDPEIILSMTGTAFIQGTAFTMICVLEGFFALTSIVLSIPTYWTS